MNATVARAFEATYLAARFTTNLRFSGFHFSGGRKLVCLIGGTADEWRTLALSIFQAEAAKADAREKERSRRTPCQPDKPEPRKPPVPRRKKKRVRIRLEPGE